MDAKSLGPPQPTAKCYVAYSISGKLTRKCRDKQRREELVKRLLASTDEWEAYHAVLLHCLRIADQDALKLPAGKRRLLRALAGIREELAAAEALL